MEKHTGYSGPKGRAVLAVALTVAFLAVLLVQTPAGSADPGTTTRAGENDVKMYFHASENLSTIPPNTQFADVKYLTNGDSLNFTTGIALSKDLACLGQAVAGGSGKGLSVDIHCTEPLQGSANLTISIFDGGAKVASVVIPKDQLGTMPKTVPFVNPSLDSYTFLAGNKIRVLFESETDSAVSAITLTYDYSQNFAGHLLLTCAQMVAGNNSLKIMDSQGNETEEFVPNHPTSDRTVFFEGTASDVLGNYDIEQVRITIKDPSSVVVLDNATSMERQSNQHDFKYSYEWKYTQSVSAGIYTAIIQLHDNSGNILNVSDTFSFSSYGVYLSCGKTTNDGVIGGNAEFTVRVYNTGGATDTVSVTLSSQNNWPVGVDQSTVQLAGGEYKDVKVTVSVPGTSSPDDTDNVDVTGTSVSSGKSDRLTLDVNAVSAYNFQFETQGSVNPVVSPGQTRTITIQLTNSGLQEDTYEVFINSTPPSDWKYNMSVPGGQKEALGSKYLEYKVTLASLASVNIQLDVSVSALPLVAQATVELGATSLGDTEFSTSHYLAYALTTVIDLDQFVKFEGDSKKTAGISSVDDLSFMRVDFQVYVKNPQTTSITIQVSVQADTGWTSTINPSSFTLGADDDKIVTVGLNPPKGTVAGDKSFAISIIDQATPSKLSKTLSGKVTIPQIHKFNWFVEKDKMTIKGYDEKLTYKVTLENKGNVQTESVKLELATSDAKGWKAELSEDSVSKTIVKGGNVTLEVVVSVDSDVDTSSDFTFKILINGTKEESQLFTAKSDISPKYLSFFTDFWWVPLGLVVIVAVAIYLRYKQTKA